MSATSKKGADDNILTYKGHPLMRHDNIIYYGSMSDRYYYDADSGNQDSKGSGGRNPCSRSITADFPQRAPKRSYCKKDRKRRSLHCT